MGCLQTAPLAVARGLPLDRDLWGNHTMSDRTPAEQWNAASEGWARWAARSSDYLVPATEKMLDLAAVVAGCRVLDVGCGSGERTVIAARRVGEAGHV